MRCQTARISMVACVAAARCGIERLGSLPLYGGSSCSAEILEVSSKPAAASLLYSARLLPGS